MRRKSLLALLLIIIIGFPAGYLLLKSRTGDLAGYLSKSDPVDANILIVEGWLPVEAIERASEDFRKGGYDYLVTTGLMPEADYFKVSMNGYLIFYPGTRFDSYTETETHLFEVSAYSETEGDNCSHFNVFMNDSLVSGFLADRTRREYPVIWKGRLAEIDSVMVRFDNDAMGEFGDRNLYVKDITVDSVITIPVMNNSEYDIDKIYGRSRVVNNYDSHAGWAKERLISTGIDSSLIKAIPCRRTKMNRTLTSALAVRDWLEESGLPVKGINVISAGIHSRRTWMIYDKILKRSYKIGIISLPDYGNTYIGDHQLRKTLLETLAVIYYRVILIPFQIGLLN